MILRLKGLPLEISLAVLEFKCRLSSGKNLLVSGKNLLVSGKNLHDNSRCISSSEFSFEDFRKAFGPYGFKSCDNTFGNNYFQRNTLYVPSKQQGIGLATSLILKLPKLH